MVEAAVTGEELESKFGQSSAISCPLIAVEIAHGPSGMLGAIKLQEPGRADLGRSCDVSHGDTGEVAEKLDVRLRGDHPANAQAGRLEALGCRAYYEQVRLVDVLHVLHRAFRPLVEELVGLINTHSPAPRPPPLHEGNE